jgi:hypothetical protein
VRRQTCGGGGGVGGGGGETCTHRTRVLSCRTYDSLRLRGHMCSIREQSIHKMRHHFDNTGWTISVTHMGTAELLHTPAVHTPSSHAPRLVAPPSPTWYVSQVGLDSIAVEGGQVGGIAEDAAVWHNSHTRVRHIQPGRDLGHTGSSSSSSSGSSSSRNDVSHRVGRWNLLSRLSFAATPHPLP